MKNGSLIQFQKKKVLKIGKNGAQITKNIS